MGGRWSTVNDLDPHVLTADREGLPEGCKEPMAGGTPKKKKRKKSKSILGRKEEKWNLG